MIYAATILCLSILLKGLNYFIPEWNFGLQMMAGAIGIWLIIFIVYDIFINLPKFSIRSPTAFKECNQELANSEEEIKRNYFIKNGVSIALRLISCYLLYIWFFPT